MIRSEIIGRFRIPPGKKVRLRDHDIGSAQTKELKELSNFVITSAPRPS
jgi:hypothetical protein